MKSINNYLAETNIYESEMTAEETTRMNLIDDMYNLNYLCSILNSIHHYLKVNLTGENNQKFKASVLTNYRYGIKQIIAGKYMGGVKIHDERTIAVCKKALEIIKTISKDNLEEHISNIESFMPELSKVYHDLKKEQKKVSELQIKESVDE